ncbi:MAG: aldehyde dehydrogenase family protein [Bacteroidales bacterium]
MDYLSIFNGQREFYKSHQTLSISFRKENLKKLKSILVDNEGRLYDAIYKDFRKSKFDTYVSELSLVYSGIDFFVKKLNALCRPRKVKANLLNMPGANYIYKEPYGNTLIIGAWNYPYQLTILPVVTAIAAGNTCIIKPSELPENTLKLMAELINENFPSDFLYVVQGGVFETTEILKYSYDKIFFTGSPKVGKIVYEAAAKSLTPVVLELGGKSPLIVSKSADIDVTVKRLVWGKFLNAGQTCIAPDYLLVEKTIMPIVLEKLKDRLNDANYADGAVHYTSIINKRNFDRLIALIDSKKIVCGGHVNEDNLYISPTVLEDITWSDPIMQEEIFGPVLPILAYDKFEETLDRVNRMEKPLSAYLFSNSDKEKELFLTKLSFGGGCINDVIMHVTNHRMPFGGVGSSGIGNYHGTYGFDAFSHSKPIVKKALWGETELRYPPYTAKKLNLIKKMM